MAELIDTGNKRQRNIRDARDHPALLLFSEHHPVSKEFALKFGRVIDQMLEVEVVAPASFAREDRSGFIHSAFVSFFLDTVMGSAVLGELEELQPIATAKLTVNHKRLAKVGEEIICHARFDGIENEIAFVSAEVRGKDDKSLIATSIGSFMIGTRSKPLGRD